MKKFCVLGHKIGYTLSPRLHASFFATLGENAVYDATDVEEDDLRETVSHLLKTYDGFNVTKPYKEKVAALLGKDAPVNTVRCGDRASTSTDAEGFLQDYTHAFGAPAGKILVLGAGGAAKAVADALENRAGVFVSVYNRTYEKAKALARGNIAATESAAGSYDAVINCTSLGLCGEQSAPDTLDFAGVSFAYDLIYVPPQTPFLQKAAAAGVKTRNGLGMLIYQAVAAQEFWRGKPFDEDTKRKLYDNALVALREKE